jgi:hypothetical protein
VGQDGRGGRTGEQAETRNRAALRLGPGKRDGWRVAGGIGRGAPPARTDFGSDGARERGGGGRETGKSAVPARTRCFGTAERSERWGAARRSGRSRPDAANGTCAREQRRRAAVEVAGPVVRSEHEQAGALRCDGQLGGRPDRRRKERRSQRVDQELRFVGRARRRPGSKDWRVGSNLEAAAPLWRAGNQGRGGALPDGSNRERERTAVGFDLPRKPGMARSRCWDRRGFRNQVQGASALGMWVRRPGQPRGVSGTGGEDDGCKPGGLDARTPGQSAARLTRTVSGFGRRHGRGRAWHWW